MEVAQCLNPPQSIGALVGQHQLEASPYLRLGGDREFRRRVECWIEALTASKHDWIYLVDEIQGGIKGALSDLSETDDRGQCLHLIVECPGVLINAVLARVAECMEAELGWKSRPPLSPGDIDPDKKAVSQAPAAPAPWSWPLGWIACAVCDHQTRHFIVDGLTKPANLSRARDRLARAGVNLELLGRVCRFVWPLDLDPQDLLELCAS